MKRLAAQLSHWYGRTRNTLKYSAAVAPGAVRIGRIVSTLVSSGAVTLIGTPVTSETWTWDDRGSFSYSLATDYADLDIVALSRRKVENAGRETSRRLRRLEERVQSIPLREPMGGSGSGDVALLKITGLHSDSPASGVRMYLGDLYANGSEVAATTEDVTVRIPGIAADVTLPSSGAWADVPACCGVRTVATWTGATATHTNEAVYEAGALLKVF